MALINCPECDKTISDKAIACPHCGLPFNLGRTKSYQMSELDQGVWVDIRTGLMWSRINIGQQWVKGSCRGKGHRLSLDDAKEACRNFDLAGYNDWRLPSCDEIKTIYLPNQAGYDCPDNVLFKPNPDNLERFYDYWTSTRNKNLIDSVLGLATQCCFDNGYIGGGDPKGTCSVRAVRRFI